MTNAIKLLFYVFTFLLLGCGTHGSIKGYIFPTKKRNLERAVMDVIKNNPNIYRDTSLDYLDSPGILNHIRDTTNFAQQEGDHYYNDIKNYVTITITSGQVRNTYTFQYYSLSGYTTKYVPRDNNSKDSVPIEVEDTSYWATSSTSELFICYAYDKYGKGGSDANGGVTRKNAKQFTDLFEKEFIAKVDDELKLSHTEDNVHD